METKGSTDDAETVRAALVRLRLPITFVSLGFMILMPIPSGLVPWLTTPCEAQTSRAAAAFAPIFASQTALAWGLLLGSLGLGIMGYRILAQPERSRALGPRTAAVLSVLVGLPVVLAVIVSHNTASLFPPCDPAFIALRTRSVGDILSMGVGFLMMQVFCILVMVSAKASGPRS